MITYRCLVNNREIVFRELNLGEWGSLSVFMNGHISLYYKSAEMGLILPTFSDLQAGEVMAIGEQIFHASMKFADEEKITTQVADLVKGLDESVHVIPAVICKTFPAYKPEDVLEFDYDTLLVRLAQISWLDRMSQPSQGPMSPLTPRRTATLPQESLRELSIETSRDALTKAMKQGAKK